MTAKKIAARIARVGWLAYEEVVYAGMVAGWLARAARSLRSRG